MSTSSVTKRLSVGHTAHTMRGAALLVAALCCVDACADEAAQAALRNMHDATRKLNYDGVFVYQRGSQLESMRVIHRYADDTETERLISLSGPAREVIRNGPLVTCLFDNGQGGAPDKNPPRDIIGIGFSAPVEKLLTSYAFAIDGRDRVAGRTAIIVTVTPRVLDRYGYRLWLDEQSNLLLKSAILDGTGLALEQVQFTHLEVLEQIANELLQPGIKGAEFNWRTEGDSDALTDGNVEQGAQAQKPDWLAHWLPAGFEFKESNVQHMEAKAVATSHLVYSDGLAMVSVFVEPVADEARALRGHSSRGAVNAFSRLADKHQITVVGEVPLATVKRIAASVAANNQ